MALFLSVWYRHSHLMHFSVTATACQDPGDDSEVTSHRPLPLLRTIPSLLAIWTAARLIAWGEAPFFRRFFLTTWSTYHG